MAWDPSTDNVGVDGYMVYRDGTPLTTVDGATLTYRDSTAAPETTYDYTVDAFDAAGNYSAQSAAAQVTTPPAAGTITLNPVADAYVDSTKVTTNYGSSNALRIDGDPDKAAYLMFDVSGITGTVTQVVLRIYAQSNSTVGHDVRAVTDTTWLESAITYSNAPGMGATLGSSGPFGLGSYIEVDITGYVTANGLLSIGVSTTHTTAIKYSSRSGANPPELVITQQQIACLIGIDLRLQHVCGLQMP